MRSNSVPTGCCSKVVVAVAALAAAFVAQPVLSFTVTTRTPSIIGSTISRTTGSSANILWRKMAAGDGEPEDGTFVKSVLNKEIAYDTKTGRFFETSYGEGECIPQEEFCYLDKESGESIRLTIEEKERIFLDSLQVRAFVRCVCV